MFTGIVEELGEVTARDNLPQAARLTIACQHSCSGVVPGDSVAVNGVCLTVTGATGCAFTADVMAETLRRTTLGSLAVGSPVNLERPMRLGGRLGGHLVQGHVDGVATVVSRSPTKHWDVVRLNFPARLGRYLVAQGSVAVDGVSLTVSALGPDGGDSAWFEVSLIPTTLSVTTLGGVRPGDAVNLEVDVIGKYVERLIRAGRGEEPPPGTPGATLADLEAVARS
jgi:riboflavin synthase